MNKYKEIMNKIEADEAMRQRILSNIEKADLTQKQSRMQNRVIRRRSFSMAAAFAVLLLMFTFTMSAIHKNNNDTLVINPYGDTEDIENLEQLEEIVGFEVNEISSLPFTPDTITYSAIDNEIAQIRYETDDDYAVFRKALGENDISGNYTKYTNIETITSGSYTITLKGNDNYTLAVWTDGEYSYSLFLSSGMTQSQWLALIDTIE